MCLSYRGISKLMIRFFFGTKAQEEPGFELTKPSTGQALQRTNRANKTKRIQGADGAAYNATHTNKHKNSKNGAGLANVAAHYTKGQDS